MSPARPGVHRARIIALLGAESTGKTSLAEALCGHWRSLGVDLVVVAEYLREFCALNRRTPRADEQRAIMIEQTRRIAAAASEHSVVLADTTALMTAAYSEFHFGDRSLTADALAAHASCAATLLLRPDLPWQADGLNRDGPLARGPVDAWLAAAMEAGAVPFASVRGLDRCRLESALAALRSQGLDPVPGRFADQPPA